MTSAQTRSEHIFDATTAAFEDEVIKASLETPVLVDLWAEWCGPCKSLGPILEKLAAEYNGSFRLAKIDVDAEQELAAMFGVRSIPTVILISGGQVVDGFAGALPEGQIREFLTKHGVQPGEAANDGTAEAATPETAEEAINRLQQAIAAEPERAELKLDLALALMRAGNVASAQSELDALPANLATDARAVRLRSQLELARALAGAPSLEALKARVQSDDADWEARDLLGVRLLIEGEAAAGLDQFLDILKRQRDWNEGQAKKRLLAAFTTLDDAALVSQYRRKMASLVF
ncbi:thioredoxin [Luteibacter rhizovicinus DSM 16549]|uniref:Thioredoxin n=1 Tax=Luteibacter rhizovicinus DSM 16549 TaxID=1440763 RepID=A0A0G9H6D8_9GAMM|nr:thioredoxin [Luteibacter rhizovicinus]APG04631.1 thioredoxin [Luteibacter rhizovicinus DSM 16549]KLD65405.1 thioredoxin [Luteibacter rhizovicinus DSM 16549]